MSANFNPDFGEIAEEAYERAGLELKTGYDLKTARRSANLISLEWANRGINLWTVEEAYLPLIAETSTYGLPDDTIDVLDATIRTSFGSTQSDIVLPRQSYTNYAALPNKASTGKPLQFTVLRQMPAYLIVWPVPDALQTYTIVYWRMRRIADVGAHGSTMDMPTRFIPAFISAMAYQIACKRPEAAARIDMLKSMYEEQFEYAIQEDRDRTTFRVVPGGYC